MRLAILKTNTGRRAFNPTKVHIKDVVTGDSDAPYVVGYTDLGDHFTVTTSFDDAVQEINDALGDFSRTQGDSI